MSGSSKSEYNGDKRGLCCQNYVELALLEWSKLSSSLFRASVAGAIVVGKGNRHDLKKEDHSNHFFEEYQRYSREVLGGVSALVGGAETKSVTRGTGPPARCRMAPSKTILFNIIVVMLMSSLWLWF